MHLKNKVIAWMFVAGGCLGFACGSGKSQEDTDAGSDPGVSDDGEGGAEEPFDSGPDEIEDFTPGEDPGPWDLPDEGPDVADGSDVEPDVNHYYVSADGSDTTGDGSLALPWKTIAKADEALSLGPDGTVVHVLPGTYEPGDFYTTSSGAAGARLVFRSEERWGARLIDTSWLSMGDYVDIVGFEFTGSQILAIEFWGIYSRVLGNYVHDIGSGCQSTGALVTPPNEYPYSHDNEISGNIVLRVSVGTTNCNQYHGIYLAGPRMIARNNIVADVPGWGIHTWHYVSDVIVENNTIFNNRQGGIIIGNGDIDPSDPYYDLGPHEIANSTIANNLVVNNGIGTDAHYGIEEYGNIGLGNVFLSNVVYNNAPADILMVHGQEQGTIPLSTVQFNALFESYQADGSGDYRLVAGAAAIDMGTTSCAAGVTDCAPVDAIDGASRPFGAQLDAGAYEYGAAPASWPWY
jgi:parallel beta-helix repeat protein